MEFHVSNDDYDCLTIYITACPEEWRELNEKIDNKNLSIIEIKTPQCKINNRARYEGKYLDCLKINIVDVDKIDTGAANLNQTNEFRIQILDNALIFNGSRKSFENLNDLALEFSNNNDVKGNHVHLDYIDINGYEYNWFCNKNIELVLGVEQRY